MKESSEIDKPIEKNQPSHSEEESFLGSVVPHLQEIRGRLIRVVVVFGVVCLALMPWANKLYSFIAIPWLNSLPPGSQLIATEVTSPILVPLKTALVATLWLCAPYLLYHVWAFIAPALYQNEKRLAKPMLLVSIFLFYLGSAAAWYLVFPVVFKFLAFVNPEGVAIMTDIRNYLSFVLWACISFGLAFQTPIVVVLLVVSGVVSPQRLRHLRPYIIVGAFVVGMLLTPPDVISQLMLAIPIWLLYELGLLAAVRITESGRIAPNKTPHNNDK